MNKETVAKVAKLARIALNDEEKNRMAGQLSRIFDWMEQLNEINTDGITEMSGVGGCSLRMREDKVTEGGIKNEILANAPESSFGCFVVPKVVE